MLAVISLESITTSRIELAIIILLVWLIITLGLAGYSVQRLVKNIEDRHISHKIFASWFLITLYIFLQPISSFIAKAIFTVVLGASL